MTPDTATTDHGGPTAPVVGQDTELAELRTALDEAVAAMPAVVILTGGPGSGRTTLLNRLFDHRGGIATTRVRGLAWEAHRPGALLRRLVADTALARSLATAEVDPGRWGELLAEHWSAQPEDVVSQILVDDAHDGDPDSLRGLISATARLEHARVLLVLAVCEDPTTTGDPDTHDVLRRLPARRIPLRPLEPEQTRLLAARVSGIDLPAPMARRLCTHTGGVPGHLLEILRDVPTHRLADWQTRLPAPRSVHDRVRTALAGCRPDVRALIDAAAVLGRSATLADAAVLAGSTDPIDVLDAACATGLLASAAGHGLDRVVFPARFVRDAVYEHLTPRTRHDLHRRAADLVGDETVRLRHRVEAAPLPDPVLAEELMDLARRKADDGEWAIVAGALMDASRISPDRADREDRLIRAVDALAGAGLLGQAVDALAEVEALPVGPRRDAVLAYVAVQRGRRAEASAYLDTAWAARGTDRAAAALICQRNVLHALSEWDGDRLVRWSGRAVEHAHPTAPAAVETRAVVGLGHAARGEIDEAFTAYRDALRESPSGPQHQRSRMGLGWLLLAQDQPEAARRELEYAAATVGRTGSNRITLWALSWLARARFVLGDFSGALQTVDQARLLLSATGLDLLRPLVHWTGAQIHALRGDTDVAARHLELGAAAEHDYPVMTIPALMARAHVAEAASDYDAVIRHLAPLARRAHRGGIDEPGFWPWHDIYANALVVTDRIAEADDLLRTWETTAQRRGHRSTRARLGYARARLLGVRGDTDAAVTAFVAARAQVEDLPLPYDKARIDYAHGITLRRAGRRRDATAALTTARQGFAALGAKVYVDRCDRELKTGRPGSRLHDNDLDALTEQEKSVAALVAGGLSNREVAAEMLLSVKTVQYHLTRTYAKLGVRSRTDLAAHFPRPST